MKFVYYFILLFCILCACQKKQQDNVPNVESFSVQPVKWNIKKDFYIKNLVKNIHYILLEENKESLFAAIDKLIIKDDRIYVLDITGPKSLLVFDISGKFLHRISRQGGGPEEYIRYINFDVFENEVYLYDNSRRRMMIYDANGKYLRSQKSSFSFFDFCILPEKKYLLSLDIHEKKNQKNKIVVTSDLEKKEISHFFFSEDFKNDKLNVRAFQPYRDKITYLLPVSDTLYTIDKQGNVETAYCFDFGSRKLPEDLKNNYEETIIRRRNGASYAYFYDTPIMIKNYVFANMFVGNEKYITVFDIEKEKSSFELLTPDHLDIMNINFPLCTLNDSTIVSYVNPDLYNIMKEHFSFNNPELEAHLSLGGTVLCLYLIE